MKTDRPPQRLTKSFYDRKIDGVCGGIARYFSLDPTLVRVGWVLLALAGGVGFFLYIVAMVIMPSGSPDEERPANTGHRSGLPLAAGLILTAVGIIWFLGTVHVLPFHMLSWTAWKLVLPGLLIIAGVYLLIRKAGPEQENGMDQSVTGEPGQIRSRRFYRSRNDRKLFGVCGGLGNYFGIDPVLVRLLVVASAIISIGFTLIAYLLLSLLTPEEPLPAAL